jgi:drug/metabolite transporter (DMT)-like permease
MTPTTSPARPATIWLALVTVYLVWGSTYLAIRVVVESAPPLLAMGTRFLLAGALLGGFLAIRHGVSVLRVSLRQLGSAALVGVLLLLCGNGVVAIAEQTVPSGLAALLIAATPLWLMVLRVGAGDRPRVRSLVGTAIGFAGIAVLARPGGHDGEVETWGLILLVAASAAWAIGSFFSSRLPMPGNAFVATMWEMTVGGALMLLAAVLRGELDGFSVREVDAAAWAWLAYLVLFGSLAAFSAYVWLLQNAPISLTATYAYVNPVVAVLLGALVLAEPITAPIVIGGIVVVIGVGLVVSTERPRRSSPVPAPGPGAAVEPSSTSPSVAGAKG